MLALRSSLMMCAAAAALVFAGSGEVDARGSGGGRGHGGPGIRSGGTFGSGFRGVRLSGPYRSAGFARNGVFGEQGRFGPGFRNDGRGRFGGDCRFGACGSRQHGYGYGFAGLGYGFDYGVNHGGWTQQAYGPGPGWGGIPSGPGIRSAPVLPPAIYVISRSAGRGAALVSRVASRGVSAESRDRGESGVVTSSIAGRTVRIP